MFYQHPPGVDETAGSMSKTMKPPKAYRDGRRAGRDGKARAANPYPSSVAQAREDWFAGYDRSLGLREKSAHAPGCEKDDWAPDKIRFPTKRSSKRVPAQIFSADCL